MTNLRRNPKAAGLRVPLALLVIWTLAACVQPTPPTGDMADATPRPSPTQAAARTGEEGVAGLSPDAPGDAAGAPDGAAPPGATPGDAAVTDAAGLLGCVAESVGLDAASSARVVDGRLVFSPDFDPSSLSQAQMDALRGCMGGSGSAGGSADIAPTPTPGPGGPSGQG
ncbi:MAG: hypothetical protein FJ317_05480, partial [SAR202 cluster bacterium]|nr:hypothetical protein [SAR202 cluster bacterium]